MLAHSLSLFSITFKFARKEKVKLSVKHLNVEKGQGVFTNASTVSCYIEYSQSLLSRILGPESMEREVK